MPGRGKAGVETHRAPGEHAVDSVDVDGRLSEPVQQELLVDDVLS